jgi:hypothetical protein
VSAEGGGEDGEESTEGERRLKRVRAIRERLGELGEMIRESMQIEKPLMPTTKGNCIGRTSEIERFG